MIYLQLLLKLIGLAIAGIAGFSTSILAFLIVLQLAS